MAITSIDITLEKFLSNFTLQSIPEAGKIILPDGEFISCASLLRISLDLQKLTRNFK